MYKLINAKKEEGMHKNQLSFQNLMKMAVANRFTNVLYLLLITGHFLCNAVFVTEERIISVYPI